MTPLAAAAAGGHARVVRVLVGAHADVNACTVGFRPRCCVWWLRRSGDPLALCRPMATLHCIGQYKRGTRPSLIACCSMVPA